jgi:Xaa-Pro aminopeptidase
MGEDLDGKTRQFFMHGTSHSLGLDVHDVGVTLPDGEESGRELEAGMVLTIEPGLYFGSWRSDIEIPERYAGIGIRIEDDILITDDGPEVLTAGCPKAVVEIESLVGSGV